MRTAKLLIAAAALLIFSACKKEPHETSGAIASLTTDITGNIELQPRESEQVMVKVLPEDVAVDTSKFKFLFDNAVARLKGTLSSRITWLNSQISNW